VLKFTIEISLLSTKMFEF